MFLLQTIKSYKLGGKEYLLKVLDLETLTKKIRTKIISFEKTKQQKKLEKTKKIKIQREPVRAIGHKLGRLVSLVVGVSIQKNNVIVYLTNVKGKLLYFKTSGMLGISKRQKRKSVLVTLRLLKMLVLDNVKVKKNLPTALHLKNMSRRTSSVVTKFLSKNFTNVDVIKLKNNLPHNGCRPKKIKRKKRKKLYFTKN